VSRSPDALEGPLERQGGETRHIVTKRNVKKDRVVNGRTDLLILVSGCIAAACFSATLSSLLVTRVPSALPSLLSPPVHVQSPFCVGISID
jgi:hypothetical protein